LASAPHNPRMRPWYIWLAVFYALWLTLNFGFGYWQQTREHWPIALAMALGSYVAGSTPMGGGTIGFPVLVLFFEAPASLGRNFGLVIQSIGMTSASIFILCRRSPIETRLLRHGVPAAAVGLLIGTFFIVPIIADTTVKLIFACLWFSFGVLTLLKNREFCAFDASPSIPHAVARKLGWAIGIFGGVTSALTGVGIDMILYTVLVLLFRMDLKVAVPSSVIIMAAASTMGTSLHLLIGDLDREVFYNWLAAAPVVILGAPLGAFLVSVLSREKTLYFVALLCVLQFVWTIREIGLNGTQALFVIFNLALSSAGFIWLYRLGKRITWQGPSSF
jgi:uncharacterized membrane protein YfcA